MQETNEDKTVDDKVNNHSDFNFLLQNPYNQVWDSIFESLPDMVALIDRNNRIVKANKAMLTKLSIGDKSLIGQTCYNLLHHDGCQNAKCPHLQMMDDNQPHFIELWEPRVAKHLHISTTPIFNSEGFLLGSLHIARDISMQKESESRLIQLNNELKEINLSKDKFFSIVAHDLRSPFQGLIGFTDLIISEIDHLEKSEIISYLHKVHDSSNNAFSLLENLLNWSRLQTGRMQFNPVCIRLSDVLNSVFNLLSSNAHSKNIALTSFIDFELHVMADANMVNSMLINLVSNAIKFTHTGGKIEVKTELIQPVAPDSNQLVIKLSVTDNGIGIPKEQRDKLFNIDSHFTESGTNNETGAGLGLLLVKEMAEKLGGKLELQSQVGVGSTFSFTLPVCQPT